MSAGERLRGNAEVELEGQGLRDCPLSQGTLRVEQGQAEVETGQPGAVLSLLDL